MDAGAGCRNPRSSRYRFMPGIKNLPDHWNQQISTQQPDRHQANNNSDNEWDWSSRVHVFGTRSCSSAIANSREKGVQGVQEVAGVQGGDPGPVGSRVSRSALGGRLVPCISISRQQTLLSKAPSFLFTLNSCNSLNSFFAICYSLTSFRPVSS